jgi:hypothetical protein
MMIVFLVILVTSVSRLGADFGIREKK